MNLAVRGIDSDIRWNNEGSFHKDELRDLKADFILANPPFNISDWAVSACATMCAGPLAHRPRAMPTMRGCSTSSITSALTVSRGGAGERLHEQPAKRRRRDPQGHD